MIRSDLCIYNWLMPLILVLFERRNTIKKTNTIWNDNTVLFVNKSKRIFCLQNASVILINYKTHINCTNTTKYLRTHTLIKANHNYNHFLKHSIIPRTFFKRFFFRLSTTKTFALFDQLSYFITAI